MNKLNKKTNAYLFLILVDMYWGITQVLLKHVLAYMDPLTYTGLRFASAGLLYFVIFFKKTKKIPFRTWKKGFVLGLILFSKTAFIAWCLKFTSTSNSVFISQLAILFVPAYYFIRYRQKPKATYYVAVVCMLVGLFIFADLIHTSLNFGDYLVFVSMLLICMQTILSAKYTKTHDPFELATAQILSAGLLGIFLGSFNIQHVIWCKESILILFLTGIIGSALASTLRIFGQKEVSPTAVSLIDIIHPIFAMIGAALIPNALGMVESIHPYQIIGSVLIVSGLLVYFLSPNKKLKT